VLAVLAVLGVEVDLVCADARYLPFAADSFDQVFSYSVIQHFSYDDAARAIHEAGRVLNSGGAIKVQMAHLFGCRALILQARRGFRATGAFDVRYWTIPTMRQVFEQCVGPAQVCAEAFGGLGLLFCDYQHLSIKGKLLVTVSETLRRASTFLPSLAWVADSTYVEASKRH
jgi:predicted SAM-dependent methyltransferase